MKTNLNRKVPVSMDKEEFKAIGYQLIDAIGEFIDTIGERPVTTGESPKQLRGLLGTALLPEQGTPASELLTKATELLLNHSLLNGHPKFFGYITSSAAPISGLADLLAASVNSNVGAQILSPMATEIEKQTIGWLGELVGVPASYSGILVSGGNMANFTAFLAARTAKAPVDIKEKGLAGCHSRLMVYCARSTHIWIEKAAILFGLGSGSIRWIDTDIHNKMDNAILENTISSDLREGHQPFIVIGTAGDVSTGAVDDLQGIAAVCKKYNLWFHIDGAYGMPAAVVPEQKHLFDGIGEADSIALDPHKWLYSSLEAGCTLVKNGQHLLNTYSSHPEYYHFSSAEEEPVQNYYEYGLQNSRGFRALKVWLTLQQVGRGGYVDMIRQDIELSELMFELAMIHSELEAVSQNLSICTFRYVPLELSDNPDRDDEYLDTLNQDLLDVLQKGGEVFLSNAIVNDRYCLRACIVNFRTSTKDIEDLIEIVVREGREQHHLLSLGT